VASALISAHQASDVSGGGTSDGTERECKKSKKEKREKKVKKKKAKSRKKEKG